MANYYELTLTSTSKEELEKIQFQLTKTLFEPHWKVTTGNIEERCEHGTDLNDRYNDLCGECTVTATEMIDESINDFVNSDDPIHPNIRPEDVDDDTLKEIILSNIQSRLHKKFGTIFVEMARK